MNEQKRFFLFLMVSFLTMFALQTALEQAGFFPKPDEKAAQKAAGLADAAKKDAGDAAKKAGEPAEAKAATSEMKAAQAAAPSIPEESIDLGSVDPQSGFPFHLRVTNKGAGVVLAESSNFAADHLPGQNTQEKLLYVQRQSGTPDSLAIEIRQVDGEEKNIDLSAVVWEVVRERPDGPAVVSTGDTQKVTFRHKPPEIPGVTIVKTLEVAKGRQDVGLSVRLESDADRSLSYRLIGPHGLPLEGQWYSYTYRDLFYAPGDPRASLISRSALNVAKSSDPDSGYPPEQVTIPIRFAGVETQYFAAFVALKGAGIDTAEKNWISESTEKLIGPVPTDPNKSDMTVALTTRPERISPTAPVTHEYAVYLGPKTREALEPYGAEELTTYRRGWAVPGSRMLARSFISPLLNGTYAATRKLGGVFGASRGSYGLAIILLTVVVRLMIFPLSRKQAMTAKRMQELQPQMQAIKDKYKDDKERQGRETMELYKKAGVNPFSGCLIAMIQLPVFMGLWQTLNNSVALRHAPFLYIDNLAAPDALFKFPGTVPFLGDYFNLLPKLVHASPGGTIAIEESDAPAAASTRGSGRPATAPEPKPATGWRAKWNQLLEEAEKQRTIQNENRNKQGGGGGGNNNGGGKARPKKGRR